MSKDRNKNHKNLTAVLDGLYKISYPLLDKLLSKDISGLELDAVIYFSRIADKTGKINDFKVSDLQLVLQCSRRSTYNIINQLREKKIITTSDRNWYGIYTITLADSDYSDVSDFKANPYLNTNYPYFDNCSPKNYYWYKQLSLYAKKTLLILLCNYTQRYGYRVDYNTIAKRLYIKDRSKIQGYMEELTHIIGSESYTTSPDKKKRLKYGFLELSAKNMGLELSSEIEAGQDSYFKRQCLLKLQQLNIIDHDVKNIFSLAAINKNLQKIYNVFYTYLIEKIELKQIQDILIEAFTKVGIFNSMAVDNAIKYARYKLDQIKVLA